MSACTVIEMITFSSIFMGCLLNLAAVNTFSPFYIPLSLNVNLKDTEMLFTLNVQLQLQTYPD